MLDRFDRWPTWMWANEEVVAFDEWLRDHNADLPAAMRVGFYGLDVYSLWESMREVLGYLTEHEPEHVETALRAWRCFEPYGEDPQEYAWATRSLPTSCEDAVVALLQQLPHLARTDGRSNDPEERFDAEQNALVADGAERYYRAMMRGGAESWNIHDHHMADTLDRLAAHHGLDAKAVVWQHNSHIGDARATDMAGSGMVNVGQLVRQRHAGEGVVLVGFGGYLGSVIAAGGWGETMARMPVPPARKGSLEDLLHDAGCGPSLFVFPRDGLPRWTAEVLPHRAIGVVYHPASERFGNYVPTIVGQRYDAFCFDDTQALHPLHLEAAQPHQERVTEPTGL